MHAPAQSWLASERQSLGYSIPKAAKKFETSRSVMYRIERGKPGVLDRVATEAKVELGSWPAPERAHVDRVLDWWRMHPLDRLACSLKVRMSDYQTPLRHVRARLLQLPLLAVGECALDFLLPPDVRPAPPWWNFATAKAVEPHTFTQRHLGLVRIEGYGSLWNVDRSAALPGRSEWLEEDGLRIAHPRDLIVALGWSPWLAAAVRAADLAGSGVISGVGTHSGGPQLHLSMRVHIPDSYWEDID